MSERSDTGNVQRTTSNAQHIVLTWNSFAQAGVKNSRRPIADSRGPPRLLGLDTGVLLMIGGSTGYQPVAVGSLPTDGRTRPPQNADPRQSQQAAETNRLAACVPRIRTALSNG
jgi:hypothetical protein